MKQQVSKRYLRLLTYLAGFFLAVHMAFPSYFNSQFLNQFLDDQKIGLIYIISSILTIAFVSYIPKMIRQIGLRHTIIWTTVITLLAITPLAFIKNQIWAIVFFIAYYPGGLVIRYALDIYLEKITDNRIEGNIRGVFLTFMNFAWLISPFLAGQLITNEGFSIMFLVAALMLLPLLYIAVFKLEEEEHHRRVPTPRIREAIKKLWRGETQKARNVRNILATDFLLNFFYAIMVIYTILYFSQIVGLNKADTGIIFTFMLIPFVLLDLPLGKIADKWLGEKEILTAGFVIMALATAAIPFVTVNTIWVWAVILFMTRVGAASVEIMKETYLFKKIDEEDTDILSMSRTMQPITYIVGPLFASVFISFFAFKWIFLALAIIMLCGTYFSLSIKDTK